MGGEDKAERSSPGKDEGEKKASPASSKNSRDAIPPPPPAESKEEEHVSGPPVKQSLFGKMKSMSISARDSLKELKNSYLPGKDVGDVAAPGDEGEERPKTATKTRTSTDEDGPIWEPGTEQLRWTDPTYKVEKFIQPGIHPNHNKNFVKPDAWWNSAEDAIKMLESERRGLKQASLDQQNVLARTLLATNRLVATRLGGGDGPAVKKDQKFRGGVEPIAHVLPPDVQRALHSKLCSATKNGEKEVMDMLLRYDIDLDYSDMFGTPLHYAAYFGQLQAANILLDKGAFPGALNYREQTPLHTASSKNAFTVVDLLVRYGAPLNVTEMGGLTAMHIAAEHGFSKVVDNLIMGGADCDKQNRIGWSPLHLACMGMHHDVIEKLCISGTANPNAACSRSKEVIMGKSRLAYIFSAVKGDTAGHFAAKKAYFLCLKVLLENGCDPCAANENGETMMHLAVQTGEMRCIEKILEYGWDFIDMEDIHGRDPIDVCDDVLAENSGDEPEYVQARAALNSIKTLLQQTSVRKNQQAHKALMEQAKRGVGGRKKRQEDAPPALDADAEKIEIEETPMDDRTMEEKISAMRIELEAARAEARASEAQSRLKTYNLNEALMESKRRLVETEFMLERERESRLALEQDVLGLIGAQEDVENLKGGFAEKSGFSGLSRIHTPDSGYDASVTRGATYERMRIATADPDLGSRTQATIYEDTPARVPSVGQKDLGRSVSFAELDDEMEEFERQQVAEARPLQFKTRSTGGSRELYSGSSALGSFKSQELTPAEEEEIQRQPSGSSDDGKQKVSRTLSGVTFQGISPGEGLEDR